MPRVAWIMEARPCKGTCAERRLNLHLRAAEVRYGARPLDESFSQSGQPSSAAIKPDTDSPVRTSFDVTARSCRMPCAGSVLGLGPLPASWHRAHPEAPGLPAA
jgi:hypothetical protein